MDLHRIFGGLARMALARPDGRTLLRIIPEYVSSIEGQPTQIALDSLSSDDRARRRRARRTPSSPRRRSSTRTWWWSASVAAAGSSGQRRTRPLRIDRARRSVLVLPIEAASEASATATAARRVVLSLARGLRITPRRTGYLGPGAGVLTSLRARASLPVEPARVTVAR